MDEGVEGGRRGGRRDCCVNFVAHFSSFVTMALLTRHLPAYRSLPRSCESLPPTSCLGWDVTRGVCMP